MSYLVIAAMLVLVLLPVIVPAIITAVHVVIQRRPGRATADSYPRRLAVSAE